MGYKTQGFLCARIMQVRFGTETNQTGFLINFFTRVEIKSRKRVTVILIVLVYVDYSYIFGWYGEVTFFYGIWSE